LNYFSKRPPSQFSSMEDLKGWTNFMIGHLSYLRRKIAAMAVCQPPAAPPPPKEVTPQCPTPTNRQAAIDAIRTRLKNLWEKAPLPSETYTKEDLMNRIGELQGQQSELNEKIKDLEANPSLTPKGEHPGTYLDKLKQRQEKNEKDLKTLNEMLDLLNQLENLASADLCPETGLYAGLEGMENWGRLRTTEREAETEKVTNEFNDERDPFGGGGIVGYNFRPWNNSVVVGPFGSFDWLDQSIKHKFPGGSFLGTQSNWIAVAGGKAGVATPSGFFLYGLAGAAWLNTDLNVKFSMASSRNTTVPGFTLGGGGEYQPSSLRIFGAPVSIFLQYQHSWWEDAHFNTPPSSPAFNYTFERDDDTIKFGLNVYLGRLH
jgi:opacity protein-like surface antigen